MIRITLPDGSIKEFPQPVTGMQIAESIGAGLAKAALAMTVNGTEKDLSATLTQDATVRFYTAKDAEGVDVIRHTLAHILAQAVKELYADTQIAIGPVIENGFYYDISFPKPISTEDLPAIEQRMHQIIRRNLPIFREEWDREEAISFFRTAGEEYKAQLITDLPVGEVLSVYRQGDGKDTPDDVFIDLCRGPHLPNTGKATAAFKLMSVAGAYWRGDSKNDMLTRIYALAFATQKELDAHLTMLEEAQKRDHRKLGKELDLFHFEEEAPGQPFWHANGWTLYRELENYMRRKCQENDYIEVNTPQVLNIDIWRTSGHWDKFRDNMMTFDAGDDKVFGLKPMSCPGNIRVYQQGLKSYRDLPLRMAEFGKVFRNEASGAMHGLMRVKAFTQDDAHVFCTADQLEDEILAMVRIIREVYTELGFPNFAVKFSDRPEMRLGSDDIWDTAENALKKACERADLPYKLNPGEGAFYGPKLEFVLNDCLGRDWQCGTIQLDLNLPERFDMNYTGEDGQKHRPIMLHRAILGSLERFVGILIENTAGHFPLWLSPVQVVVTGITNDQDDAVQTLVKRLKKEGIRAEADLTAEKVSYKVRAHSVRKVPVIAVLGGREVENQTVAIRRLGSDAQTVISQDEFVASLKAEIAERK